MFCPLLLTSCVILFRPADLADLADFSSNFRKYRILESILRVVYAFRYPTQCKCTELTPSMWTTHAPTWCTRTMMFSPLLWLLVYTMMRRRRDMPVPRRVSCHTAVRACDFFTHRNGCLPLPLAGYRRTLEKHLACDLASPPGGGGRGRI